MSYVSTHHGIANISPKPAKDDFGRHVQGMSKNKTIDTHPLTTAASPRAIRLALIPLLALASFVVTLTPPIENVLQDTPAIGETVATKSAEAAGGTVTVKGTVRCYGSDVVGIWVSVNQSGKSRWASWHKTIDFGYGSGASYNVTVPKGSWFRLTVGCGGSARSWNTSTSTSWKPAGYNSSRGRSATCYPGNIRLFGGPGCNG